MEATAYVEINAYGSAVIAGTGIHVDAIGYAHEDGESEQVLMQRFGIDRVQLHGALAYFYQNREAIQKQTEQMIQEAMDNDILQTNVPQRLRNKQTDS